MKLISHIRVITKKQGDSGFGLEVQRASIETYINGGELIKEYLEVESGKNDDRPEIKSIRTKAALKAAKARGINLGNPKNLTDEARERGQKAAALAASLRAFEFAQKVWEIIEPLTRAGLSLRGIAKDLNARDIKSARGGVWTATSVKNIIQRMSL